MKHRIRHCKKDEMSPHFCWENFGEIPINFPKGNGNFCFFKISQRNLSISLQFPSKDYGENLVSLYCENYWKPSSKTIFHARSRRYSQKHRLGQVHSLGQNISGLYVIATIPILTDCHVGTETKRR